MKFLRNMEGKTVGERVIRHENMRGKLQMNTPEDKFIFKREYDGTGIF
jgi:hypothetical protein